MKVFPILLVLPMLLSAEPFAGTYTTEIQTDFKGKANWINQLRFDCVQPLGVGFKAELASYSISRTAEHIIPDRQMFSNIEEENNAFILAVAGCAWERSGVRLFGGVRNVNEDYFTTETASLFTNSSCGIFPTISANMPLANYPLSSMCVDGSWSNDRLTVRMSLYNGTGHNRWRRGDNVFVVNPVKEGLMTVTSVDYDADFGSFSGGAFVRSALRSSVLARQPEEPAVNAAWWVNLEPSLRLSESGRLDFLVQYSENPVPGNECRRYGGAGARWSYTAGRTKGEAGVFADWVEYAGENEWLCELTWKCHFKQAFALQPALQVIGNRSGTYPVALLRFSWQLF